MHISMTQKTFGDLNRLHQVIITVILILVKLLNFRHCMLCFQHLSNSCDFIPFLFDLIKYFGATMNAF